jgi:catechol 2,3-dioxygenase-like lactoylglutathione lyase family enzyme
VGGRVRAGIVSGVRPKTLDHVALWTAERERIADVAERDLGMHVIERTDRFTLVGADARRGKLTLFDADGPRVRGALRHIGLRVGRLDGRPAEIDAGEGLVVRLVEEPTDVDFDLDHVALVSRDPEATAAAYVEYGFRPAAPSLDGLPRVEVGGAHVEFHPGEPGDPDRPLLNHLAVLVDSAEDHRAGAEARGIEVADVVDAPNTLAVFVWLPERVKLEYVEHKPTFSLR